MRFEFDPEKSRINRQKHGIGFDEATRLWEGRVVEIPARESGERRMLAIGKLGGKHWSAIITMRKETIRIISVRRARNEEKAIYENDR